MSKKYPAKEYKDKKYYINSIEAFKLLVLEKFKTIPPIMSTIPCKEDLEKMSIEALHNLEFQTDKVSQRFFNHFK